MELRTTREMRRNEQLTKAMAQRGQAGRESVQPPAEQAQRPQTPADKLSVSAQALAWVDEQSQKRWDWEARERKRDDLFSSLESKKEELDALAKAMDVMKKCQKIAAAIMKGDKVPPEDMEYLMNNDPDGFKLAFAMRREKKDPEDCESVLDEEDRRGTQASGEAQPVEASGPSGGEELQSVE